MDLLPYKEKLGDYLSKYHNININRPFNCLNPDHEDRHPSMSFSHRYNICKCFSCGVVYDIFDVVKIDYGLDDFKDQLNKISEIYDGKTIYEDYVSYNNSNDYEVVDYTNYFNKCRRNINKTNYLQSRGIDSKLISKYNIGFDEEKQRIVFPINNNCFFARGINNNLKIKSRGTSYLWNEDLLKNSNPLSLIYVTEGIIDALTLETINPKLKVVSLNGLPNTTRLIELIKKENYNGNLVLVFDKDYAGLTAQKNFKEELDKINISSFSITLISNYGNDVKDVNEALIKDKNKLVKNVDYFNGTLEAIIKERNETVEEDFEI